MLNNAKTKYYTPFSIIREIFFYFKNYDFTFESGLDKGTHDI